MILVRMEFVCRVMIRERDAFVLNLLADGLTLGSGLTRAMLGPQPQNESEQP
jgi:hypothetical protein